jgi:hypothetical protein
MLACLLQVCQECIQDLGGLNCILASELSVAQVFLGFLCAPFRKDNKLRHSQPAVFRELLSSLVTWKFIAYTNERTFLSDCPERIIVTHIVAFLRLALTLAHTVLSFCLQGLSGVPYWINVCAMFGD